MVRNGKYTKRPGRVQRSRHFFTRQWQSFRSLSRGKQLAIIAAPIAAFLILTPLITYAVLARDISDPERLMNRNNTGVTFVDKHNEVFFSTGSNKALKRLKLDEISDYTEKAVVSSEDKNFYTHQGFSVRGIMGAVFNNATGGTGGGSTLTQQLAKNTLLSSERSFLRKYQELFVAIAIEQQYTKDEILDMYLNSVYYGEGAFGIDEAAKTYFNKSANDLDLAESSMLIGLLPAPGAYSPINGDPVKAKQRQTYVLKRMVEDGKITDAERDAALAEQLTYAEVKPVAYENAPHFAGMVMERLYEKYGEEKVKRSGYKVKTTLDLSKQKEIEAIVKDRIAISSSAGGRNAAVVAIDPKTGGVLALVGSADYNNPDFGKVNMAIASRQPGSSFKPIYFTEAIDQKLITASTIIRDEATDFNGYKPENYDFKFRGDITVRNALSQSLNIPAVKVMQKLGVKEAIAKAREMGLKTIDNNHDYGLSLALGAAEVRPVDMANAYAAFADGGRQHEMTLIDSIESKYGETIFRHEPKSTRVQSTSASFVMSDILSDNTARAPSFGSRLNIPGHDVAVKTGSTDDNRDAWTIGYTPSIAVAVWVGNNENEVMSSGGSAMAGPIWSKSIQTFIAGTPNEEFVQPSGVVKAAACTASGGTYQEFFLKGTTPSKTCQSSRSNDQQETPKEEPKPQETDPDTDGDGVPDSKDKCPAVGGTVDGTGCPKQDATLDTDGDGVPDSKDKCPAVGSTVDSSGCPKQDATLDTDGDGVPDSRDACPATPAGTTVDRNGCPPQTPPSDGGGAQGSILAPRRYA
jgi:penicillin-binding protein 1A